MRGKPQRRNAGSKLRSVLIALPILAFSGVALGEPASPLDASQFGCDVCMSARGQCTVPNLPGRTMIAEVSGAHFEDYVSRTCLDGLDTPCHRYSSNALYSFGKVRFIRNDFGATAKTQYEAYYAFSVDDSKKWNGIHLREDKSYLVIARDRGLFGIPSVMLACEIGQKRGEKQ